MLELKNLLSVKKDRKYSPNEIILSKIGCFIDPKIPSALTSCGQIYNFINKPYRQDPLLKKLFTAAAIHLLESETEIVFSNKCTKLYEQMKLYKEKKVDCGKFGTAMQIDVSTGKPQKVTFYLKTENKDLSKTEHVQGEVSGALARYAFKVFEHGEIRSTPYFNKHEKEFLKLAAMSVMQKIMSGYKLKDYKSYVTLRDEFCDRQERITNKLMSQFEANNSPNTAKEAITAFQKLKELHTVGNIVCKLKDEDSQLIELGFATFEDIAYTLVIKNSQGPTKMAYLEPVVNYFRDIVFPTLDEYIKDQCLISMKYRCYFDKDDELQSIVLVDQ